jgi:mono/diheme cytochrome c family protein
VGANASRAGGLRIALALGLAYAVSTRPAAAQQLDGTALYREHCRTCHGAAGKPTHLALSQYPKIPVMDAAFVAARSADSIVTILTNGKGKDMKSFKEKLSPAEMRAVAEYVRSMAAAAKP